MNFTKREIEVMTLLKTGDSNIEIAAVLALSKKSIEMHLANIKAKLGIKTTRQLIAHLLHE